MNEKETFPVWVSVSLEVWVTRPLTTIPDRIPKLQDNFNPSIGGIFHSIFSSGSAGCAIKPSSLSGGILNWGIQQTFWMFASSS